MDMRIMHTAAALIITSVVTGVIINNVMHGDVHMHGAEVVHVVAAPVEVAPAVEAVAPSLGGSDPIIPLVCGVNLNCSDMDRMAAAKPKGKSSRTVRTTHSSTGATSTSVTQKTPAGSTTVRTSRTAKGVTTTSTSTTVSR
jgi:hypothetical protein